MQTITTAFETEPVGAVSTWAVLASAQPISAAVAAGMPIGFQDLSKAQLVPKPPAFETWRGGARLCEELDLMTQAAVTKRLGATIKDADYDGVPGVLSRRKAWLGFELKL